MIATEPKPSPARSTPKAGPATPEMMGKLALLPRASTAPYPLHVAVETITPEQAVEWLAGFDYERQRARQAHQVTRLALAMRAGHYSEQGIILVCQDGQWKLTNGQHRLAAIIEAQLPVREVVIRKWLSPAAAADEYGRTDLHRGRTTTDMLRAHALETEFAIDANEVKLLGIWTAFIMSRFDRQFTAANAQRLGLHDPDQRFAAAKDWLPEAQAYLKLIRDCRQGRRRYLNYQATGAVALVTLRYGSEKAKTFWDLVSHAENPLVGDPVAALLVVFGRPMAARAGMAPEWARMVAACWNAYSEERPISAPWQVRRDGPITINESPYRGWATESRLVSPFWEKQVARRGK